MKIQEFKGSSDPSHFIFEINVRVGNVTEFRSVLVLFFSAIQKIWLVLVPFFQC